MGKPIRPRNCYFLFRGENKYNKNKTTLDIVTGVISPPLRQALIKTNHMIRRNMKCYKKIKSFKGKRRVGKFSKIDNSKPNSFKRLGTDGNKKRLRSKRMYPKV